MQEKSYTSWRWPALFTLIQAFHWLLFLLSWHAVSAGTYFTEQMTYKAGLLTTLRDPMYFYITFGLAMISLAVVITIIVKHSTRKCLWIYVHVSPFAILYIMRTYYVLKFPRYLL